MKPHKTYTQAKADRVGAKLYVDIGHAYDSNDEKLMNDDKHQKALKKFKRKVTCYYERGEQK